MRTLLICLSLAALTSSMHPKTNKALVVHNIKHFDVLYSKLVSVLKNRFSEVRIESVSSGSVRRSTYVYKKPIYDLVVVILPRWNDVMGLAEKLELLKFYDEGNSVLFLSDSFVVQNWRVLLSQYGFDATTAEGAVKGYNGIQTSSESRKVFVDRASIHHPKLARGIKKGLIYEGGAITLTPYENLVSWPLLEAPEGSLFVTEEGSQQLLDANKMNLVVGAQGTAVKARLAVVGSFKMFSNQIDAESDGDNIVFFRNLINWLRFESQVLSIRNYEICDAKTNKCGIPLYLPNQHGFSVKFQILDEDGQFYVPPEGNLSLKVTKQILFANVAPQIVEEGGKKFYFKSFGPIENGSYKVKVIHNKPGYYLDFKENIRYVHAVTTRIDKIELFTLEGLPFLGIVLIVMFSALNLIRLTANRPNKSA